METLTVFCPHCLERMPPGTGSNVPCPVCGRDLGAAAQDVLPLPDYDVQKVYTQDVADYVQALEQRARTEHEQQPYQRKRFPVDLVAGVVLIGCGLLLFASAFLGGGGLFTTFINTVLPAFVLLLVGVLCVMFWAK